MFWAPQLTKRIEEIHWKASFFSTQCCNFWTFFVFINLADLDLSSYVYILSMSPSLSKILSVYFFVCPFDSSIATQNSLFQCRKFFLINIVKAFFWISPMDVALSWLTLLHTACNPPGNQKLIEIVSSRFDCWRSSLFSRKEKKISFPHLERNGRTRFFRSRWLLILFERKW